MGLGLAGLGSIEGQSYLGLRELAFPLVGKTPSASCVGWDTVIVNVFYNSLNQMSRRKIEILKVSI